ncbi:preprotein translocase subunit SecA, partial [Candidatus Uhrbacteria bacterium]|nr:preprotein translocase subunit SecA [Candidatus Uhrbacteria bacterium]
MAFLNNLFGDPNARFVKSLQPLVSKINSLEPSLAGLSDDQLKDKTREFRERLASGTKLDDLLPEAFAAVREAGRRALGQRHFDVQLIGGMVLHKGQIAEMKTGEGKTLTATGAVYLNALEGKGVHVVTVNDYLAKRDAIWMGQIYAKMGMTTGCINHEVSYLYDSHFKADHGSEEEAAKDKERDQVASFQVVEDYLRPVSRKESYLADVTYGTNNEFGFDYLRDNMVMEVDQMVQRDLHYAIIDEVDSILIDEARTPLIISAPAEESTEKYYQFAQWARQLVKDIDYNVDEKLRAATFIEAGQDKMSKFLGFDPWKQNDVPTAHHMEEALRAEALFKRDKDYVVKDDEVIIVDEFTGRLMFGRRYSGGLHQAIEAKENVKIQRESQTLATITFQNLFRMYKKLAGMTGTAVTEAEEFHKIYNLEVTMIPPNRLMVRKDLADRVYKNERGKFLAVAKEIKARHAAGQPVLVGTISIEKNELLSELLKQEGVPHEILNAKNHEKEAAIIAQAGRLGAVTVATNMAGRGVDIILGGNPADPAVATQVRDLGGLAVLGTERHESRRIDNQLRGRSGRQGDPGASQFYISMEDDLMRIFGPMARVKGMMERMGIPDDMPIEN